MTGPNTDRPDSPPETVVLGSVADIDSLTEEITLAILDEDDGPAEGLPPLNEYLDPDALDALFTLDEEGDPRVDARFCFRYGGYQVAVDSDGPVVLRRER